MRLELNQTHTALMEELARAPLEASLFRRILGAVMRTPREEEREEDSLRSLGFPPLLLSLGSLEAEIKALEAVTRRLVREICDQRKQKSTRSMITKEVGMGDHMTRLLSLILKCFHIRLNVTTMAQYISLLFIGLLIAISVRGFLTNLTKFLSAVSGGASCASSSGVLFLAELMGTYFVASVMLRRNYLALQYRLTITEVLGGYIQFNFFYRWFDAIFVASSVVTMAVIAAQHTAKRTDKHPVD